MPELDAGPFLSALSLTTLAELGDKSFMVLLGLATAHPRAAVLAGAVSAFALLNVLAVALGAVLAEALPVRALLVGSGVLFIALAIHTLRADDEDEDAEASPADATRHRRHAFGVAFFAILLAEMGDKTQIAIAGLAARFADAGWVLLGGTVGLALVSLVAVTAGAALARQLPTRWLHRLGAALFALFGILALAEALSS